MLTFVFLHEEAPHKISALICQAVQSDDNIFENDGRATDAPLLLAHHVREREEKNTSIQY